MRSTRKNTKKQSKKDYKKIFEEAYLNDPEYRAVLVKIMVNEDDVMLNVIDQLAKLFED